MFIITEAASSRLAKKLTGKQAGDDVAMRFVRERRGWKLRLDTAGLNDVAFEHERRTVLLLDQEAAQLLVDRTLDARDTAAGSRLYLR